METESAYYELVNIIKANGIKSPKRHGEYISLNPFDDWTLMLDTWNSAIEVFQGTKRKETLGSAWGGISCNIYMVKFWLAHLGKYKKSTPNQQ